MKLHYDPETDSLYIDLNAKPGADAQEVAEGLVVDFDADGKIVGMTSSMPPSTWTFGPWKPCRCRRPT